MAAILSRPQCVKTAEELKTCLMEGKNPFILHSQAHVDDL